VKFFSSKYNNRLFGEDQCGIPVEKPNLELASIGREEVPI
jgi:hypothetical protein